MLSFKWSLLSISFEISQNCDFFSKRRKLNFVTPTRWSSSYYYPSNCLHGYFPFVFVCVLFVQNLSKIDRKYQINQYMFTTHTSDAYVNKPNIKHLSKLGIIFHEIPLIPTMYTFTLNTTDLSLSLHLEKNHLLLRCKLRNLAW